MPDITSAIASTYVEPRGAIRSVIAKTAGRELAAALGGAIAGGLADSGPDHSPLKKGSIAFLAVFPDEIVLFAGKRGAFKPKATEEVIATAPRDSVATAELERKKVAGVLTVTFQDGATWAFDMPKVHLKTAERVAGALA
jgi:hypothetical protein